MQFNSPYEVRLLWDSADVYAGPGTEYVIVGSVSDWDDLFIVEEKEDRNSEIWGRLKSGAGWIMLKNTKKPY